MFSIVILFFTVLFAILGVVALIVPAKIGGDGSTDIAITRAGGGLALLISVVILAFLMTTMVPARTVGVVTAFGKPTGTLPNGLHVIKP